MKKFVIGNSLNIIRKIALPGLFSLALIGCGVNNNVTLTANNGICPPALGVGNSNPYCMSIQILNNGGGQNWINSTNFPISQISYTITGVSNVQSPAQTSSMDPNNCGGSTISPGGSCTFYLKITGENFPVLSQESINVSINYTINNTLFGGSTNTASTSTTVYQLTNLYTAQNNGNLTVFNNAWSNYGLVESNDITNSIAIDNSSYGMVYLGGNLGVYKYGLSNNAISSSISPSGFSGANNLISSGASLYAALKAGSSTYNIWSLSFSSESWISQTYSSTLTNIVANTNAITTAPILYFASNSPAFLIYACNAANQGGCTNEGTNGIIGNFTSLGFLPAASSSAAVTGLYAGTTTGLYYESGAPTWPNPTATWNQINGVNNVTTMLNATESSFGSLLIGDSSGNIWSVNYLAPTTATTYGTAPAGISAMTMDTNGNVLYVTTTANTIYSCSGGGVACTPVLNIINTSSPYGGTTAVVGMGIGSMLINSLNNPYNGGGL